MIVKFIAPMFNAKLTKAYNPKSGSWIWYSAALGSLYSFVAMKNC
jgi:hypothetical protein